MKLLPQKMDDVDLIKKIKSTGDNYCFQEIVNRHSGIYLQMVHYYAPKSTSIDSFYDFINNKESHIYDAINKYDQDRNIKFSTYLGNHTRWLCLNSANKRTHQSLEDNFDKAFESKEIEEKNSQELLEKIFEEIKKMGDERIEKIFNMRYKSRNGKQKLTPWRKIAKELDLSIQGCINIHNSAFKKLKKTIIKNHD